MKKRGIKIIISAILFVLALVIPFSNEWINNGLFIISYLVVGCEILKKAVRNIFRGKVFDENFLMAVATIGAFAIGEFPEAVAVMLFYQVGELFQSYAVDKSRKSIASLMDIRPDYANIEKDGKIEKVDPDEVKIGDIIIVKTGEKIPLDGVVVEGRSSLDTMALTGESVPRVVKTEDEVLSGCINKDGLLKIRVTKEFGESTVSKILDLVENASSKKSKSENFITKFAKYYTPTVVIIAVLLAFIPPIILKDFNTFSVWLYRALSFLVVSCPCALVISIPLSFFGGIGGASKMGILIKGSNYLEALANTETVVFDKTGTLTEGIFEVQDIYAEGIEKDELLRIVAHAENYSNHPIAKSVKKAYNKEIDEKIIKNPQELSGKGIWAKIDEKDILVGNEKLMLEEKIEKETIDITLPATKIQRGSKHPVNRVIEEIEDLFVSMGYDVISGPELETDEFCFARLNLPEGHPARDMQDSFYITDNYLLRTQTSAVQARTMLEYGGNKPIRMICTGKTYRREDDATHSHQFNQVEGLVIDKKENNVSLANLKGTLEVFMKKMLGEKTELRFRPSYFPFTEPSYEVDVTCFKCGGKGCPLCKKTGWIEVLGAGMVHPNVLKMNGYDPDQYSGFAFGTGIDRLAMFKFGIPDMRLLYSNDIKFLNQFARR